MNNSKKSASDSQLNNNAHGGDRERDGSNDSAASNNTVASAVVNSIWNGASAVGNYVWSFWGSPQSRPVGLQQLSQEQQQEGVVDAKRTRHQRANSNPEPLSNISILESEDYGIRLLGRTVTGGESILTQSMINKIHAALPPRFRLCTNWRLLYSTPEHGFSLSTLFSQCRYHEGPTLVVVRDDGDAIFGVFATESWKPHFGHYGTGECFLWRVEGDGQAIKKYGSTGKNAYYMISESNYMAAGCGEGKFGFWLDGELLNGLSQPVPTFDNECLAIMERFKCVNLELWGLDMTPLE